jgi:cytochrome oxidase assembly protein ShyY1
MTGFRLLLSKKWLGYLGVVVAFALICAMLANWQWNRHEEKMAVVHQLEQRYDAAPVPVDAVLPGPSSYDPADEWQPVEMTGRYLVDETLLVRNRPYNGQPGFAVLVPFQIDGGRVFVVDRGWVPTGNDQDAPDVVPAPPTGEVTVIARVKPGEPAVGDRTAVAGTNQIATIQLSEVQKQVDREIYSAAYGQLLSEDPTPASAPVKYAEPEIDTGLNLSYFVQWIMFAAGAFLFLFYVIRQEQRNSRADAEEAAAAADRGDSGVDDPRRRERRPRTRPRHDDDVEDEILDAVSR